MAAKDETKAETKEQRQKQRRQRKAEFARQSRLRKKDHVSGLEEEIAELKGELSQLKQCAAVATSNSLQVELTQLDELLKRPKLDSLEVNARIERFVEHKRARQENIFEYLSHREPTHARAYWQLRSDTSGAGEHATVCHQFVIRRAAAGGGRSQRRSRPCEAAASRRRRRSPCSPRAFRCARRRDSQCARRLNG